LELGSAQVFESLGGHSAPLIFGLLLLSPTLVFGTFGVVDGEGGFVGFGTHDTHITD